MLTEANQSLHKEVQQAITKRSLSSDTYLDEIAFDWRRFQVDGADRRMNRKRFRIINRQHKINSYPEE